ncbi:MAG: TrbG/VirB9 family P-type conjugative transfer protein [Acidobacteria bacterium]|nr:TrbG/VirB9 family P-type conjugative transfer protein [Acidobacteriota bacterium]MCI0721327.1 TrbG/VirB9 family P-type conjugative transfer protein [Acidobacteriota bacterium]
MKKVIQLILFLVPLPLWAIQPRTLSCNFDGENRDKVYKVATSVGVGTTFRLPEGWKITDFVVTDPKQFHAESNGTIGIVTPLVPNKATSVSIFTENDRLFVFSLSSEPSDYADLLVIIDASNLRLFNEKVRVEAHKLAKDRIETAQAQFEASIELKAKQVKQQLLFSLNSNYEIKDQKFSISRVVDDRIFTYIQLAKSQERPVVYVGETNDPKKLEPVKYTDEGEYYTVHRVLSLKERKRFFLKLGNETSEIRPQ